MRCLPGHDATLADSLNVPTQGKSFSMEAKKEYSFLVTGEENLEAKNITIIDQKKGYSNAIYLLSVFLSTFPDDDLCNHKGTRSTSERTANKSGQGPEGSYQKQTLDHSSGHRNAVQCLQFHQTGYCGNLFHTLSS